jgi:hypothetical protein
MQFEVWDGWMWLLLTLGPLLFVQRKFHFELQAVFLLLTRRVEVATVVFSLVFFPGILVHELSHYLTAKLLRVRTGKISLIPEPTGRGRILLGYVETAASDPLRDTLIGMAPLIVGGFLSAYIGLTRLGLGQFIQVFQQAGLETAVRAMTFNGLPPDFWLWLYLAFTISSMMLPSESDRRSWWLIGLWIGLLIVISLLAGTGPWLVEKTAPLIDEALTAMAILFGISLLVHMVFLLPVWGMHLGLRAVTGLDVG